LAVSNSTCLHVTEQTIPGQLFAMDALGLLGLSTIPEEFRDPIEDFRDPIEDFRDPIEDFRDPIEDFRDPIEDFRDPIEGFRDPIEDGDGDEEVEVEQRRARRLLSREVRVGVDDGRVFEGILHCLDKQQNLILYDTVEYRSFGDATQPAEPRALGLVLIPARCRTSCHVKCSLDEKMDFLKI
jgi:small nuclear ribonucleoprotein (snRNP)-like protein